MPPPIVEAIVSLINAVTSLIGKVEKIVDDEIAQIERRSK